MPNHSPEPDAPEEDFTEDVDADDSVIDMLDDIDVDEPDEYPDTPGEDSIETDASVAPPPNVETAAADADAADAAADDEGGEQ